MKIIKKLVLTLLLVFVAMQFYRPQKNSSRGDHAATFSTETNPPPKVRIILENTCYNCHSNNTVYPWYNNVAPVSYWLSNHIDEGKENLNLSAWDRHIPEEKVSKLDEIIEVIEADEMPLKEYRWGHKNARLTKEEKKEIIEWAIRTRALYQLGPQPE